MGRSRNLADLLDANGDVKATGLDNVPPSNDASALTTGTLSADRLAAGSIGAAKLAETYLTPTGDGSGLTGIETFDDNKLVNDVSTLALRMAASENAVAYNTNSSFIDIFRDDSGVSSTSNALVNVNEFVSSVYTLALAQRYWRIYKTTGATAGGWHNELRMYSNNGTIQETVTSSMLSQNGLMVWSPNYLVDGDNGTSGFHTDSSGVGSWLQIDFGAGNEKSIDKWSFYVSNPKSTTWNVQYSNDNSTWTTISSGWNTAIGFGTANVTYSLPTTTYDNATGSFESTTTTAPSSVSSMNAIITYEDTSGTNALNTDIVLQLSADGGSNWSTATLTALPNYSSSIKMAKVNDLAVTAGTSLKYKISFANQASGSKEARIRGVALQY